MSEDTQIENMPPWVDAEVRDPSARRFLEIVYRAIEVWDDIIDRDEKVSDEDIHAAFTALLLELPFNSFFERHKSALCPAISTMIVAWHASNELRRLGGEENTAHAYVLRKEFINLCLLCVTITQGMPAAIAVAVTAWAESASDDSYREFSQGK